MAVRAFEMAIVAKHSAFDSYRKYRPRRERAQSLDADELELRCRCKSIGLTSQRLGYRMYGSGFDRCRSLDFRIGLDSTSSAQYPIPDLAEAKATLSLRQR